MDTKKIAQLLKKLDDQSFRPGDSVIASTINHPIDAVGHGLSWLNNQVNTAVSPYASSYEQLGAANSLAGLAQLGSMPMAPASKGGTLGSITAWHGSPHKFDKFDMSKIGTGEGAQAYGHGLYFAENPSIAKGYKKSTSYQDAVRQFRSELPDDADFEELIELSKSGALSQQNKAVIDALANDDWLGFDYPSQAITAAFKQLDNYDPSPQLREAISSYGNLYKTSLEWPDPAREAADPLGPHHFLDFDKPLNEQENVWNKLKEDGFYPFMGVDKGAVYRPTNKEQLEALRDAGIPGIRYLDAGSRGAGDGSYNYVVFDDQIPKIVERNGNPLSWLLPATMLGAGMMPEQENDKTKRLVEALRNGNQN